MQVVQGQERLEDRSYCRGFWVRSYWRSIMILPDIYQWILIHLPSKPALQNHHGPLLQGRADVQEESWPTLIECPQNEDGK